MIPGVMPRSSPRPRLLTRGLSCLLACLACLSAPLVAHADLRVALPGAVPAPLGDALPAASAAPASDDAAASTPVPHGPLSRPVLAVAVSPLAPWGAVAMPASSPERRTGVHREDFERGPPPPSSARV